MTDTLYPHEVAFAWIERHITGIYIVVAVIITIFASNALLDILYRNQYMMYSYGSCDIGMK